MKLGHENLISYFLITKDNSRTRQKFYFHDLILDSYKFHYFTSIRKYDSFKMHQKLLKIMMFIRFLIVIMR